MTGATTVVGCVALAGAALILYLWNKLFKKTKPALGQHYQKFPLTQKEHISADTMLFRFALPDKDQPLGLPTGSHITVRQSDTVVRSYTPVTNSQVKGYFDIVVKIYPPTPAVDPCEGSPTGRAAFTGGKMGNYLKHLPIGEHVEMKGPTGDLEYVGRGQFAIKRREGGAGPKVRSVVKASRVGMVAGGTGLTPMLQIINESLLDPHDATEFHLLFANKTEADILYHKELQALQEKHARMRIHFTVDTPVAGWPHFSGFVNEAMLAKCMPFPSGADVPLILMCGPPPMINMLIKQLSTPSPAIPQPLAHTQFYAF
jgi:cytochrome-b5 reductase